VAVSFIFGGHQRKQLTCHKSWTNIITSGMIPLYDLGPLGSPKYHQQSQNNWKYNKYSQCTIFSIFPGNVHQRCRFYTTPWFIHHSHVFIAYGLSRTALNSVFRNLFIYSVRPYVPIWISPSSSYAECKHPFSFKTDIYIIVHRNMFASTHPKYQRLLMFN
jgi:hypothetical protein